jgi:hypothetical protein
MNTKRLNLYLSALAFAGLAFSPTAQALKPPPDGGYPNQTTAEGDGALFSLTTGFGNTALGFNALYSDTEGRFNTATGRNALFSNTTGIANTATGGAALLSNTEGSLNTAHGRYALQSNTTGSNNTVNGFGALFSSTEGSFNTAEGWLALENNTTGNLNTALGADAGINLATTDNNIDIGNVGDSADSNTIRIGTQVAVTDGEDLTHPAHTATFIAGITGTAVAGATVKVNANGQLGVAPSSERFKSEIKPMDKASEAILALKPVSFRYKKEVDPEGIPQFGLVAEQVAKVNPALVDRDGKGKIYTVRYEAVNAMLLNEFLKEHCNVQTLQATIAQQQQEIKTLSASLKEQASQIQKVSARLEVRKPALQTIVNK